MALPRNFEPPAAPPESLAPKPTNAVEAWLKAIEPGAGDDRAAEHAKAATRAQKSWNDLFVNQKTGDQPIR